jgi:hypothetical protein
MVALEAFVTFYPQSIKPPDDVIEKSASHASSIQHVQGFNGSYHQIRKISVLLALFLFKKV